MQKHFLSYFTGLVFLVFLISSCKNNTNFSVDSFDPLANYNQKKNDSICSIQTDLKNSVLYGIEIPTVRQVKGGKFAFSFHLKNNTGEAQRFFYKLYYQNESYKWKEGDTLDFENFYGSWEETAIEFKSTDIVNDEITVTDSFRIIGNPRNEKIYLGINPEDVKITPELLALYTRKIYEEPDWKNSVLKKAAENKVVEKEQVYFECLWAINNRFQNDTSYNNRWKRNPRMGKYKFMLVVCSNKDLGTIPHEVKNISKPMSNGNFANPFSYFITGNGKDLKATRVVISQTQLAVSSELDAGSGIYIDPFKIKNGLSKEYYNNGCGESDWLYRTAQFAQYFHHINRNWEFANIKERRDVVEEKITRAQYKNFISDYSKSQDLVHTFASIPDCPCKTVGSDSTTKTLTIFNPGNDDKTFKKEHVGIMSRLGFTYGKWRAKIKFPKIMSEDNVWNGITAAYWLIFQADAKWNMRRPCDAEISYIPKHVADNADSYKEAKRQITYSEIDFEILKESKFWTQGAYGGVENYPTEDASNNNDVTICCTNWDMACHQPKNFIIGAKHANVEGKDQEYCRWDYFSKLFTSKVAAPHKEVFNDDFYYFEIDWQPERIIWRIGKDKNNLKEICRMNSEITSIPSNQMVMVMSQEFHYQEWWPTAPFMQNYIPFPKNNIVGKLMSVEIE